MPTGTRWCPHRRRSPSMSFVVSTLRGDHVLTPGRRRALRWVLTAVVVAVVGVLFTRTLARNWDALADVDLRPDAWVVGAVVLFALAVVLSGVLWGRMIAQLGRVDVGARESIRVHCLSWLLKYIPGQVGDRKSTRLNSSHVANSYA